MAKTRTMLALALMMGLASTAHAQLNGTYTGSGHGNDANNDMINELDTFSFDSLGNLLTISSVQGAFDFTPGSGGLWCWYVGNKDVGALSMPYNDLYRKVYHGGSSGFSIAGEAFQKCFKGADIPTPAPQGQGNPKAFSLVVTRNHSNTEFDYLLTYDQLPDAAQIISGHAARQ